MFAAARPRGAQSLRAFTPLMAQAGRDAEDAFDRSIDTHVSRLRQKLGADARGRLKTIRGVGYLFTVEETW